MRSDLLKNAVRATVPRPLRNWLRSPRVSAEWIWDSVRFSLGSNRTLQLPGNWSVSCHPHVYKVFRRAQIADPEQSEEFRNFLSHCSDRMFLFDIGAHFGIFSLAAAHFGGKAIAVDPSPTATRMIARQAALNQCTGRVRILQASVSNQDGAMDMVNAGVLSEGYFQVIQGRSKSELTRTAAVTIDHMTREFGPPTHVKVDVEGHEMAVLLGARATLTRFSPVLFLELHNEIVLAQGNDPTLPLDELARSGYGLFALNGRELSKSAILERPIARIVARRTLGSSLQGEVVSD